MTAGATSGNVKSEEVAVKEEVLSGNEDSGLRPTRPKKSEGGAASASLKEELRGKNQTLQMHESAGVIEVEDESDSDSEVRPRSSECCSTIFFAATHSHIWQRPSVETR